MRRDEAQRVHAYLGRAGATGGTTKGVSANLC
jgi:hypothetical protein